MTEAIMLTEKGTGTLPKPELLHVIIAVIRLTSQGLIARDPMRIGVTGLGSDMSHYLHISPRMVQYILVLLREVQDLWHMGCTQCQE